jgi:hypothetical protein
MMSDDYFEIAWINHDKPILHGQRSDGSKVERVLTDDERERVYDLNARHAREMQKLLREMAL